MCSQNVCPRNVELYWSNFAAYHRKNLMLKTLNPEILKNSPGWVWLAKKVRVGSSMPAGAIWNLGKGWEERFKLGWFWEKRTWYHLIIIRIYPNYTDIILIIQSQFEELVCLNLKSQSQFQAARRVKETHSRLEISCSMLSSSLYNWDESDYK